MAVAVQRAPMGAVPGGQSSDATSPLEPGSGDPGPSGDGPRIELLGSFELTCRAGSVELPLSAQRLLALLALHDRPLRRVFVAGTLWLDSTEDRAAASLRSVLWRLRSAPVPLVAATGIDLCLDRAVAVDVRESRRVAARVLEGSIDAADIVSWADALSNDLLPHWYDDWLFVERERHRQLRLRALESMAATLVSTGRLAEAMDAALGAVAAEPLRESANRALIRVHLAEGNRAEAIRHYQWYRRLLDDELGVPPSSQIEELIGTLRARAS